MTYSRMKQLSRAPPNIDNCNTGILPVEYQI